MKLTTNDLIIRSYAPRFSKVHPELVFIHTHQNRWWVIECGRQLHRNGRWYFHECNPTQDDETDNPGYFDTLQDALDAWNANEDICGDKDPGE